MLSPSFLARRGDRMTKEEFEAAIAACGVPCWVALRSGDELPCSTSVRVTADFVVFETEEAGRLVRLADVQSVNAEKRSCAKR